jgi:hypothetical protein
MRLGMGLGLGNLLSGQPLTGFPNDFSFNFDGSNDYLDIGTDLESWIESPNKSFSAWVKNDGNTSQARIFNVGYNDTGNLTGFGIGLTKTTNNKPFYFLRQADGSALYEEFGDVLNTTDWYHFFIAIDGSANEAYIYQNGALKVTVSNVGEPAQLTDKSAKIGVAWYDTTQQHFNGLIDEIAIWDSTLDATAIGKISSKVVDLTKYSASNLKLWLRAGDKVLPEEETSIARSDFYTDFDGTNDYVSVADNDDLSFGDGSSDSPFSISAWINMTDATSFPIIAKGIYNSTGEYYFMTEADDKLYFGLFDESVDNTFERVYTGTLTSYEGSWLHVCVTYNGVGGTSANAGIKIYLNGVSQSLTTHDGGTYVAMENLGADVRIGYNEQYGVYADGKISNLAIHQTELDAQTISQMAKSRFTPMRDNRFSAVSFDGGDDRIDVSATLSNATYTVIGWVNKTRQDASYFADFRKNSGTGYIAYSNNANNSIYAQNGTLYVNGVTGTTVPLNAWTHICVTGITIASSIIKIGCQNNDSFFFQGSYSSVSIYSGTKSAEEVYAIYQQGITYDESSLSGLVGYWRMGDDTSKAFPTIADSSSNSNDGTITNGTSDDIVQQMVAGYDMGAFESTEELGEELIENGVISTNQFTLNPTYDAGTGKGVTLNNGTVRIRTAGNTAVYIEDNNLFESGALYKIVAVVSNATAGDLYFRGGNVYVLNQASTVGTHIIYLISDGTSFIIARDESTVDISISSLSVKKVFQSDLSDTYPAIIDVNEPVLGVETITNGDFATDSDWTKTSVTISGGKANFSSGGTTALYQDIGSSLTGMYFISFEITDYTSGTLKVFGGAQDSYSDSHLTEFTAVGSYVEGIYLESSFNGNIIFGGGSFTGSIDNVSVKSVQGNVGNMTNQATDDLVYSSVLPDQSFLVGNSSPYNFIDLGGTDEYISVDGIISDIATQTGTINLWAMPTSDNGAEQMLFTYNNNSIRTDLLLRYSWGQDRINVGIAQSGSQKWFAYSATNSVSSHLNNWNMITLVHDGTESKLYANGSELNLTYETDTDKTFWLGDMSGVNKVSIGIFNYTSLSNAFIGKIGQSAVWNKNLSEPEILAIYTLGRHGNLSDEYSEGLKGYWAMSALDASTGLSDSISTIYDRSGNSNHGTPTNADAGDLASSPNAEPNGYSKGETNRSNNTP